MGLRFALREGGFWKFLWWSMSPLTVIHDAPVAYEMMKPYVLAIVEMEEGCRLTSQIIDVDPANVKIGIQVEAAFRKLGSEGEAGVIHHGYKFRPAS